MKIKVIIMDQDANLTENWAKSLSADSSIEFIGFLTSVAGYENQRYKSSPDVIYLNLTDEVPINLETITYFKNLLPKAVILVQIPFSDEVYILQTIAAGASGYLTKDRIQEHLIPTIKEIYHQGYVIGELCAGKLVGLVHQNKFKTGNPKSVHSLTCREKQILSRLVKGSSYKMIAIDFNISYETVRSHTKNMYSKLNVGSLTELVALALTTQIL